MFSLLGKDTVFFPFFFQRACRNMYEAFDAGLKSTYWRMKYTMWLSFSWRNVYFLYMQRSSELGHFDLFLNLEKKNLLWSRQKKAVYFCRYLCIIFGALIFQDWIATKCLIHSNHRTIHFYWSFARSTKAICTHYTGFIYILYYKDHQISIIRSIKCL